MLPADPDPTTTSSHSLQPAMSVLTISIGCSTLYTFRCPVPGWCASWLSTCSWARHARPRRPTAALDPHALAVTDSSIGGLNWRVRDQVKARGSAGASLWPSIQPRCGWLLHCTLSPWKLTTAGKVFGNELCCNCGAGITNGLALLITPVRRAACRSDTQSAINSA